MTYICWLGCVCVSGADDSVPAAALERESQSHERTTVFPTGIPVVFITFHQVS